MHTTLITILYTAAFTYNNIRIVSILIREPLHKFNVSGQGRLAAPPYRAGKEATCCFSRCFPQQHLQRELRVLGWGRRGCKEGDRLDLPCGSSDRWPAQRPQERDAQGTRSDRSPPRAPLPASSVPAAPWHPQKQVLETLSSKRKETAESSVTEKPF